MSESNLVPGEVPAENTDREIWRRKEGDFYSPSIHVTKSGCVGLNVGGHVIVMSAEKWHALGGLRIALDDVLGKD